MPGLTPPRRSQRRRATGHRSGGTTDRGGTSSHGPVSSPPRDIPPPGDPPNPRSVSTRTDPTSESVSTLVTVHLSDDSAASTSQLSWTEVVAGSPHSRRPTIPTSHGDGGLNSPPQGNIGINSHTADNIGITSGTADASPTPATDTISSTHATPVRSTRRQSTIGIQALPHPLGLGDLTTLLEEITSINTKLTEDRKIQTKRQAEYIDRMADMDLSLTKTTKLSSNLMTHLTQLQSNMELALSNVRLEISSLGDMMEDVKADLVMVKDTAAEAHSLSITVRDDTAATMASLTEACVTAPTNSDVPAVFATTEATVIAHLRDFTSALGSTLDSTLRARAPSCSPNTSPHHLHGQSTHGTTPPIHTVHSSQDSTSSSDSGDDSAPGSTTPPRNPRWPNVDPSRFKTPRHSQSTTAGARPQVDTSRSEEHRMSSSATDSDAACATSINNHPSTSGTPYLDLGSHVRCYHHRDGSFDDDMSPHYKPQPSPSQRISLTRNLSTDMLAWHAGSADGDPLHGAALIEPEDVLALGLAPKHANLVAEEHCDMMEHWNNNRWISRDTLHYGKGSYTPPSLAGPHIETISKQLATWDKLSDLSPLGWLGFYTRLRRLSFRWKISLMPFEAISLNYEYLGHCLCHCGLGLTRWRLMGDALFLVLEYLLPLTNSKIATTLECLATSSASANGYELLWTLLKEFIPWLDRTKPPTFPTWPTSNDIHQYARLVILYCDLAHHHGTPYSDAMRSRIFLTNVKGAYAIMAQHYNMLVGTYCPGRDGVLHNPRPFPRHLTILELARDMFEQTPSPEIHTICNTTVDFSSSAPSGISITSPMSSLTPTMSQTRPTHIQGYMVHTAQRPPSHAPRRAPNPAGRNTNRPRYEGTCAACGKYGHEAVRCDMLIWLFLSNVTPRNERMRMQLRKRRIDGWSVTSLFFLAILAPRARFWPTTVRRWVLMTPRWKMNWIGITWL